MTDRLDPELRELLSSYNEPQRPPLEEIWTGVEAQLDAAAPTPTPRMTGGLRRRLLPMVSGLAAALLFGFMAGRLSSADRTEPGVVEAMARNDSLYEAMAPYRQTASRYLGQTAVLLLALESSFDGRVDSTMTRRAGELLTTTRLLLDSPAAQDDQMRNLISDLELVLAQINRLDPRTVAAELELITDALRDRELLPRIHTAVTRAVAN